MFKHQIKINKAISFYDWLQELLQSSYQAPKRYSVIWTIIWCLLSQSKKRILLVLEGMYAGRRQQSCCIPFNMTVWAKFHIGNIFMIHSHFGSFANWCKVWESKIDVTTRAITYTLAIRIVVNSETVPPVTIVWLRSFFCPLH